MPRLKAEVQIRKETALEALRDALRASGRSIRPRQGCPGYGAVHVALSHWLGLDFGTLGDKSRLTHLRAATQWDTERNTKAGPHKRVDAALKDSLTSELVAWLVAPGEAAAAAAAAAAEAAKTLETSANAEHSRTRTDRDRERLGGGAAPPHGGALSTRGPSADDARAEPRAEAEAKGPGACRGAGTESDASAGPPASRSARTTARGVEEEKGGKRSRHPPNHRSKKFKGRFPISAAHAVLHPDCPHFRTIAEAGAIPFQHVRPGDSRPHVDFLLPDGSLDCRFDDYVDGLFDDDDTCRECECHEKDPGVGLFDPALPGAFAARKPIKHGDHVHAAFGVPPPGNEECGCLWPSTLTDHEFDSLLAMNLLGNE